MFNHPARTMRMAAGGLACLVAIASAPLAVTTLGEHGVALPGLASAQQVMSLLDARSPGERTKGELSKTKVERLASPRARALGKVFPPQPTPTERLAQVIVPNPPAPIVEAIPPVPPAVPPALGEVISPSGLIASAPLALGSALLGGSFGGGLVGPPPGGGGGGGGITPPPTGTTPPPVDTVAPAVPEPGTWLMMLLGFGMIGSAMRGRGRLRGAAAAA